MSEDDRSRSLALSVLCGVLFVTFLDNTVVSVTLADIQSDLHAGVQTLQWVINGYALTFASLMLVGGMLGDLFGRRRVMLGGLVLFSAGSVVAALAPGPGWLLVGRVIMGVGAAGSEPGTLSIIRHLYKDQSKRARALGVWAAVSGGALAAGPVIAGLIVGVANWRGVFWFNVAIGGTAFIAALRLVPESADPEGAPVDVAGSILGAAALASVIFAVIEGESSGYATWWIIALFVVSGVCAAGFGMVELRQARPVLDLRLFRRARFAVSNIVAFTTYFGIFSIFFFVALYLQLLAGQSPFGTAADFVPMTVLMIAGSAVAGRWVARSGPKVPMTVGCAVAGIGILIVDSVLGPNVGFGQLSWSLGLVGAGFGVALVPVVSASMTAVEEERSGMAAAATNTSRELGAVFGVAVLGAVVNGQLTSSLTGRLNQLGIPANFQSVVIAAVTHGGVPQSSQQAATQNPAAAADPKLVDEVIGAAERAFYTGLHSALLISACLLLASAVLVWFTFGRVGAHEEVTSTTPLSRMVLEVTGLVVVLVAAAIVLEVFLGSPSQDSQAAGGAASTTTVAQGTQTAGAEPKIRLEPATGLHDGQQVKITGSGFAPGTSLVALQCADRGDNTSSDDCDIVHVVAVEANDHGDVAKTITVRRGPFGASKRTCSSAQPCEITVSQPSANAGAQRATVALSFGPP